jgi:hypothetical protein
VFSVGIAIGSFGVPVAVGYRAAFVYGYVALVRRDTEEKERR